MSVSERSREAAPEAASASGQGPSVLELAMRRAQSYERLASARKQQLDLLVVTRDPIDPRAMQQLDAIQQLYDLATPQTERAIENVAKQQAKTQADQWDADLQRSHTTPDQQALVEAHGSWANI